MPKNLVVCSDGTSNTKKTRTNVRRFYDALNKIPGNVCFYDPGVGSFFGDVPGKAFGTGVGENIRQCYDFLVRRWEPGDRIFLFGFSRGAFTVRSLANFVDRVGLVTPTNRKIAVRVRKGPGRIRKPVQPIHIERAYALYELSRLQAFAHELEKEREELGLRPCAIHCIGVWDTVGAVGLPSRSNDPRSHLEHRHHDSVLSPNVKYAFHALSLDDERRVFWPDRFRIEEPAPGQTVEEVWFAGMHSDVGGGYDKEKRMSNVALRWMASRMPPGLGLRRDSFPKDEADPLGPMHDSREDTPFSRRVRRPQPGDTLHASVLDRIAGPLVKPNPTREPHGEYRPDSLVQKRPTRSATAFCPSWDDPPDFDLEGRFRIADRGYR